MHSIMHVGRLVIFVKEMAAMRHVFASHVEKCTLTHPQHEHHSVSKTIPIINNVETITIDPPADNSAETRSNSNSTERLSSPPSPQNGHLRNTQPISTYHIGSTLSHQLRPHADTHHLQVARQGSASLPINIPAHSPTHSHPLRHTPPHARMPQSLRPTSLPQTLTVSPIQIPSPTPTPQGGNRLTSSNQQATLRHSQPALNPIKIEVPPFRPPLPYVIDDDITIEKEVDAKKKQAQASAKVYDVEASPTCIPTSPLPSPPPPRALAFPPSPSLPCTPTLY